MTLRREAVLLVDWLNLMFNLQRQRLIFGADQVSDLIRFAEDQAERHGECRLVRAHFVSEDFGPAVEAAINQSMIGEVHRTRRVKEQADIELAVLAMDQLHDFGGCPQLFVLATGDQDFIPLIKRIVLKGASIVLVVASLDKLTAEYRALAAQRNITLLPITDIIHLKPFPDLSGERSTAGILGLFRTCVSGGILGGAQDRNIALLESWGVLTPGADPDVEFTPLLKQFTKVEQRRVAIPARKDHGNHGGYARRTFLNFELPEVTQAVEDADWVLRRIAGKKPTDEGTLSLGRFRDDDGTRLDRTLAALKVVGWISERSDGQLETSMEWAADGLLEPQWRVVCELNRRAYEERVPGVSRDRLFRDLCSAAIARDGARRGGRVSGEVIDLARRMGVIDSVLIGPDGYALTVIESHPVAKQVTIPYKSLGQLLDGRIGTYVPEHEILGLMSDWDDKHARSTFGFDTQDRQRVLRVLRRSRLIDRQGGPESPLKLKWTRWLRKLMGR
jgi:hypothetical protein